MTTEKNTSEKRKTERRSYFLIILRTKMQIGLQVGGKSSTELEKGKCCENLAEIFLKKSPDLCYTVAGKVSLY